jgi:hypothetical protein
MKMGTTGINTSHIAILIVWQRCKRYDPIKLSQSPSYIGPVLTKGHVLGSVGPFLFPKTLPRMELCRS